jgi:hypothetical protein
MYCPACGKESTGNTSICTFCGAAGGARVETDVLDITPDAPDESSLSVESVSATEKDPVTVRSSPTPDRLWAPKREQVEGWAFKREVSHYDVLGLEETASKEELAGRMGLLKSKLSQWANNATDFGLQQVGSSGLSRFVEIEQLLGDEGARQAYDERLKVERHSRVVSELRKEVGIAAADGVLQWSEWIGLQEKARAVGVSAGELEEIIGEYRARGVLTGLSLANAGREVRTINELRDACGQDAGVLIEPLWNGALGDWLQRAANKPQLREFVEEVREEYEEARLSGVWLFLWEIGEKKLVLGQESGEEVLSAEAWAQGIESARLSAGSLEALKDRRLENWFRKAIGRDDLGRVAQQLREEQNHDLSTIVRATRAKGSDPIFEWKDGTAAYSLAELATQCDHRAEEAEVYVFNRSFETRLQQLGKAPLATSIGNLRTKYGNTRRIAVEMLTRELCRAAKINPYPVLVVAPTLELGKVSSGDIQSRTITIDNRGRGFAWGKLKSQHQLPGLSIPPDFNVAEHSEIGIELNTVGVGLGEYSTDVTIEGEGLSEATSILITYEIVGLELAIDPESINFGSVPIGGRGRATIRIVNRGRGQSPGFVKLEPQLPGITFTQQIAIASNGVAEIGIDLDALHLQAGLYATHIVISGDGFADTFKVPLSFAVVPLDVQFQPASVSFGKIAHGKRESAGLKMAWLPGSGRVVGTARIDPAFEGLTIAGVVDSALNEIRIELDTTPQEAWKRRDTYAVLDTNAGQFHVPVSFETSIRWQIVVLWTAGIALAIGIGMFACREILAVAHPTLEHWLISTDRVTPQVLVPSGFLGAGVALVLGLIITIKVQLKKRAKKK